jgi:hypothetical protein
LLLAGALACWALISLRIAGSFLAGGALAGLNLAWLHRSVRAVLCGAKAPKRRILIEFFCRVLLIPLGLYAMIRFLFLSVPAAVAGFAVFSCSVLIEGILEAFGNQP